MALENQWVTYLHRSYKSIKSAILARMQIVAPEITDHSESNIFVIIINAFAGLVEQLNYYIDNVARELYITSARRYSSMIKLTRLIDYRVKAKVGAVVDLKITAVDTQGDPVILDDNETLNSGLIVTDSAGIEFITQKQATIFRGSSSVIVGARQRTSVVDDNLGTTTSSPGQAFQISDDYQDDTLQITIQASTWDRVDTFAFSGPLDMHFIVEVDQNKQAWVLFGDDTHGAIPPTGQSVLATYYKCRGISGNVEANTITTWGTPSGGPTPPSNVPVIDSYTVTNELPAVGGFEEEGLEDIRKHAPLSLRTLNRAVTLQDHTDLCLLVPGVGKAATEFVQSLKKVIFYVAPDGGGTAPGQLLSDVEDYFETRKMISTVVEANAAGETKLRLTITATAKFRRDITETENDIIEALQDNFGFNASDVDKQIRRSDIIAVIDNLDKVDYLKLNAITTKPYPRIIAGSNTLEDKWYVTVQSNSSQIASWRVAIVNSTTARVWRTGPSGIEVQEPSDITFNTVDPTTTTWISNDNTLRIGIWDSGSVFDTADEWGFKTYPYNEDHEFEDYTIPVFDVDEVNLTVNSQVGIS